MHRPKTGLDMARFERELGMVEGGKEEQDALLNQLFGGYFAKCFDVWRGLRTGQYPI